ncbi:CoA pyrophosphatase [Fretibacter rubidus]|uniref:CoA pyrophosphatase n=1 Tax=Fretibacter rubidus TaxID=570162 RepID=UPI00352A8A45
MSDINAPIIKRITSALLPLRIDDDTDLVKRDGQRVASVLMPLVQRDLGWQVILTQRPMTMPRHPGQISFPGGRREDDETALQAALRETEEEVGLPASVITVLGRLPSFDAVSDYRVTPFVGVVDNKATIVPCEREVEEAFEVPLDFILNGNNHIARDVFFDGRDHRLYDMPYDGPDGKHRNIWGMTAMMMRRLYEREFA